MADILIVDDEINLSYSISVALRHVGHECRVADTAAAGLAACADKLPDLALVDLQLPDANGLELVENMRRQSPDVPIIVITAFGTVESAVAAMKQGAFDYLQKPLAMEEVALTVDRALENRRIRNRLDAYEQAHQRESGQLHLIGECDAMKRVIAMADRVAEASRAHGAEPITTLLLGETGTGKEVLARYIHDHAGRAHRPFVQINCTAVPEELFESELFGHEAGAFTNAKTAKKGLFEVAHEGTLFLDEIGDMPAAAQAKLLVAIESGRFRRLGATTERTTRVHVMAATNSRLQEKVDRGEFRADLFYRLKVFCIELPRLNDRDNDLVLLAEHYIERYCRKFHKPLANLPPDTLAVMRSYSWPGNVRELANVLQRAILVSDTPELTPAALGIDATVHSPTEFAPPADMSDLTLAAAERRTIQTALQRTDGNISEAARLLGLTRGGLRHRMDKLGLK